MKELLAVFDQDEVFAKRLCNALNKRADCPYDVRAVSDREDLRRLSAEGRITVFLKGEGAEERDFDVSLADRVIRLSSVREELGPGTEAQIYKYQPVAGLLRAVLSVTDSPREAARTPEAAVPDQGLIGVASPVGRCGKTAFAMTLTRLLGEERSVLYADLEACSSLCGLQEGTFSNRLSDLLYMERVSSSGKEPPIAEEEFIKKQWGIDVACPADCPEVLFETPSAEIVRAAERLFHSKPYEAAVLDLGSEYLLIREFIPKLRKLYVPTLPDALSRAKTESFLNWVRKCSLKLELSVETVILPDVPVNLQGEDPVEGLLFSEMGSFVRKMLSGGK